jgi:hypothetical protein
MPVPAEGYLDELRAQETKNYYREPPEEVDADEEGQKQG